MGPKINEIDLGVVSTLWPDSVRARIDPPTVTLNTLSHIHDPELSSRDRARVACEAVVEAIFSKFKSEDGKSRVEHFCSIRTNSYPNTTFCDPSGKLHFTGLVELLQYSGRQILQWAADDVPIREHPFIGRIHPGFLSHGPGNVLIWAARSVLDTDQLAKYRRLTADPDYHLNSLSLLRDDLPPREKLRVLEDVLCEIVHHQLRGRIGKDDLESGETIHATQYASSDGITQINGNSLLDKFAQTLGELGIAKYESPLRDCANEPRNDSRVMRYVREEALKHKLTVGEELSLFAAFDYSPSRIFQAWSLIHGSPISRQCKQDFLSRYPGLQSERPDEYFETLHPGHEPVKSPRRLLIDLVLKANEGEHELALSPGRTKLLAELLVSLSRRDIQSAGRAELILAFEESAKWFEQVAERHSNPRALQVIAEAHHEALLRLKAPLAFAEPQLNLPLQEYQKEGAQFLVEKKRAILGDSYSLGKTIQAIAAAESCGVGRVLWVTDASNRINIRDSITNTVDLPEGSVFLLDPPSEWGKRKVEIPKQAKYIVVSYDTLREIEKLAPRSPEWNELQRNLRGDGSHSGTTALIVDESQLVDNPATLRTQAVRAIKSDYAWLLSATPFQNNITSLFESLHLLDPERFPDKARFRSEFLSGSESFEHFISVFQNYFLGREQSEVALPFEDPKKVPVTVQMAQGLPRYAKIDSKLGAELDQVIVPDKVATLYLFMLSNFYGWAKYHNTEVHPADPDNHPLITISGQPMLQKFGCMMGAIYEPHKYGLASANYLYSAAAALAGKYLDDPAKKVVCFGENISVLEGVQGAIGEGAVVFSGALQHKEREELRREFESGDSVRALIVQARCGGLGLSFRRADAVVNLQPYQSISQFGQVHGRVPRNIYPGEESQPGIVKQTIPYHYLSPTFSPDFINGVERPELREILERGTIAAVAIERLLSSNKVFEFLRAGTGGKEVFEKVLREGIMKQAGLTAGFQPIDMGLEKLMRDL